MFVLSDDKSAYGTLKALVTQLNKDVDRLKAQREHQPKRSHHYINLTGQIGGTNSTISLIMTTDVWREGAYKEQQASKQAPHMHAQHLGIDTVLRNDSELQEYLRKHDVHEASLWYASTVAGIDVTACVKPECLVPQM